MRDGRVGSPADRCGARWHRGRARCGNDVSAGEFARTAVRYGRLCRSRGDAGGQQPEATADDRADRQRHQPDSRDRRRLVARPGHRRFSGEHRGRADVRSRILPGGPATSPDPGASGVGADETATDHGVASWTARHRHAGGVDHDHCGRRPNRHSHAGRQSDRRAAVHVPRLGTRCTGDSRSVLGRWSTR